METVLRWHSTHSKQMVPPDCSAAGSWLGTLTHAPSPPRLDPHLQGITFSYPTYRSSLAIMVYVSAAVLNRMGRAPLLSAGPLGRIPVN